MAKNTVQNKQKGSRGLPKLTSAGTLNGARPHTKGGSVGKNAGGRAGGKT